MIFFAKKMKIIFLTLGLHLPNKVQQWGRLCDYSAFAFESFISFMKKFVHGRRFEIEQISRFTLLHNLVSHLDNTEEEADLSKLPVYKVPKTIRRSFKFGPEAEFYSKIPFKSTFLMGALRCRGPAPMLPRSFCVRANDNNIYYCHFFVRRNQQSDLFAIASQVRIINANCLYNLIRSAGRQQWASETQRVLSDLCDESIIFRRELSKFTLIENNAYSNFVELNVSHIICPLIIVHVAENTFAVNVNVQDELF